MLLHYPFLRCLSVFFSPFFCNSVWSFWVKRICAEFLSCVHIWSVVRNLVIKGDWHPINRFNPAIVLCLTQARNSDIWRSLCVCVMRVKMNGYCSFCWYWWNCWRHCVNFLFIIVSNTPLDVMDTDCIARYNSNFHTDTTTTTPIIPVVSSLGKLIMCGILYIAIADLNQFGYLLCSIYLILDCSRRYHLSSWYYIRIAQ